MMLGRGRDRDRDRDRDRESGKEGQTERKSKRAFARGRGREKELKKHMLLFFSKKDTCCSFFQKMTRVALLARSHEIEEERES